MHMIEKTRVNKVVYITAFDTRYNGWCHRLTVSHRLRSTYILMLVVLVKDGLHFAPLCLRWLPSPAHPLPYIISGYLPRIHPAPHPTHTSQCHVDFTCIKDK
jgi:hypothetical protein